MNTKRTLLGNDLMQMAARRRGQLVRQMRRDEDLLDNDQELSSLAVKILKRHLKRSVSTRRDDIARLDNLLGSTGLEVSVGDRVQEEDNSPSGAFPNVGTGRDDHTMSTAVPGDHPEGMIDQNTQSTPVTGRETLADAISIVLEDAGTPLRSRVIQQQVRDRLHLDPKKDGSIKARINKMATGDDTRIKKVGMGLFAPAGWSGSSTEKPVHEKKKGTP